MPDRGEVRKREQRARDSAAMTRAAAELRRRGPGFAALDDDERIEAVAALLEEVAARGGLDVTERVWTQAVRTAERITETAPSTSSTWGGGPDGPSPAGHRPPDLDRTDWPLQPRHPEEPT